MFVSCTLNNGSNPPSGTSGFLILKLGIIVSTSPNFDDAGIDAAALKSNGTFEIFGKIFGIPEIDEDFKCSSSLPEPSTSSSVIFFKI